jgi:RNA polymerase sigma-70 factor (ECF subfamily)
MGTSLSLLQRLRNNEQDAWQRLVQLYTPLVRYWCGRWGARGDALDDLVQEVFQAASRSLTSFRRDRPGDTFRGWLRGISRNIFLMHLRRNSHQPQASGGTDAFVRMQEVPESQSEDDPPPEVNALYRRALELVRSEFEERTWQMFWLTVIDGRSPVDVANQFGVSAAAVRKAKSRILHRLKTELGDLIE